MSQLKQVNVNEAIIHYTDTGKGEPIVFVHGSLEDYRTWDPQIDIFSKNYRIITYSRRFNFPNQNTKLINDFSPKTEAEDLAALITEIKLGPVHLVGHSYGGLVTLFLIKKYPELVRTLTLSEPPLIKWLPDIKDGKILYENFYSELLKPVRKAFEIKDTDSVLRHTLIYFASEDVLDNLPTEVKNQFLSNLPEWHSIANSSDAFVNFEKEYFKNIKVPVLLLSGGETLEMLKLTNKELENILPEAQRFHLVEGTHDFWMTHPQQMGNALMSFLKSISIK